MPPTKPEARPDPPPAPPHTGNRLTNSKIGLNIAKEKFWTNLALLVDRLIPITELVFDKLRKESSKRK